MIRRGVWVSVAVLLLGGLAQAQEKVDLRLRMNKGDRFAFSSQNVVRLQMKITAGPQTQDVNQTLTDLDKGTVTVLAAENGVPSSVRIAYEAGWCGKKTEAEGKAPESVASPLAGKTVTATRGADGKVTTDYQGQIDPGDLKDIEGHLAAGAQFLPKQPVAVGEEWDADEAALRAAGMLGPTDRAQVRLKLLSVTNEGGTQKAQIAVKGALEMTPAPNMPVKMQVEGTVVLDLAHGNATAVNLKGTMTIAATQQAPGADGQPITVQVNGSGTMENQSTTTFTGNAP